MSTVAATIVTLVSVYNTYGVGDNSIKYTAKVNYNFIDSKESVLYTSADYSLTKTMLSTNMNDWFACTGNATLAINIPRDKNQGLKSINC